MPGPAGKATTNRAGPLPGVRLAVRRLPRVLVDGSGLRILAVGNEKGHMPGRLVAAGESSGWIAADPFVSVVTVKSHLNNLYRKQGRVAAHRRRHGEPGTKISTPVL